MAERETRRQETSLFGAAITLTVASLVNLLVNLLIQMQIAAYFGVGAERDAYKAAIAISQWLQFVLGVALTLVLVPFFVTAFKRNEGVGWRAASVAVNVTVVGLLASVLVGTAAGGPLIRLVAGGLPAEGHRLAVRLFQVTLPAGVLLLLQAMLVNVSHARFRFIRPAAATFLNGAVVVTFLGALHQRMGILALPVANLLGTGLSVVVLASLLMPRGRYRPTLSFRGTGLGQAALIGLPLVLAAPIYQSETLVGTHFGSYFGQGVLSYLGYSHMLWTAMMQATASGLAGALFPFLSRAAAEADRDALRARFVDGVSAMLYITVPIAALAAPLAHPGIRGLFQRGAFRPEHVGPVGNLLLLYLPAYVAWSLGSVTSNTIFALRRTLAASALFVLAFGVFFAAVWLLLPVASFYAIALGGSIHAFTRLGVSGWLLRRYLGRLGATAILRSGWCILAGGGAAGLTAYGANALGARLTGLVLLPAVAAALAGLVVYLVLTLFVLRSPMGDLARTRLAALFQTKGVGNRE